MVDGLWRRLVTWQGDHGRKGLPWQGSRDPYRVWLSEVMLQQTQVATVLDYFARFLERFPDVTALAEAPLDEVLGLWSGLGYYSRARNLHRCAQSVVQQHGGVFPRTAAELAQLPGIGPSTAAAVAAFCFDECAAILDGNVKRVLARVLAFPGDVGTLAAQRELWAHATTLLPGKADAAKMPRYTQALMDLGATVCLARNPVCGLCPLRADCRAWQKGKPTAYPVKTKRLTRSAQSLWLLWARHADGSVWLVRRPETGIWAGLYALPAFDSDEALRAAVPTAEDAALAERPAFKHVLTHRDLHLHPVVWRLNGARKPVVGDGRWFAAAEWRTLGLPAPIRRLLEAG